MLGQDGALLMNYSLGTASCWPVMHVPCCYHAVGKSLARAWIILLCPCPRNEVPRQVSLLHCGAKNRTRLGSCLYCSMSQNTLNYVLHVSSPF